MNPPREPAIGSRKLCLFVAVGSPNGNVALINLRKALAAKRVLEVDVEVVDVEEEPDRALAWRVLVTPTLVWSDRPFGRRLVGDLSSHSELSAFLE